MIRLFPFLLCLPLASCSIAIDWSAGMKPETYSGRVLKKSNGSPVAGADIELRRHGKKLSKSGLGAWAAVQTPEVIGSGTSKADGSFAITTLGGYATAASASKGKLYGYLGSADQSHPLSKPLPSTFSIEVD